MSWLPRKYFKKPVQSIEIENDNSKYYKLVKDIKIDMKMNVEEKWEVISQQSF